MTLFKKNCNSITNYGTLAMLQFHHLSFQDFSR